MSFLDAHLLTLLFVVPAAGAIVVFLVGGSGERRATVTALAAQALAAALVVRAVVRFDPADTGKQLGERVTWIATLHADYAVSIDGLSLLLIVLTALVGPMAVLAWWPPSTDRRRTFSLVLLLQAGMFGVFTAESFFHWFVFWEMVLIPAFFLVGRGDRPEESKRAALKFLLYTLVGSVAMFLAFQAILWGTGTVDFTELAALGRSGALERRLAQVAAHAHLAWSPSFCGTLAFGCIVLACAIKTPLWPFHTWLPDAYGEAPTPATLLLTGGMSKMGVYALLRLALPLFPDAASRAAPLLLALAVITGVAAAFSALAQTDLKRMMAYSSVNHVGLALLGVFAACRAGAAVDDRAAALDGAVLMMFIHGIEATAMFFLLAALERRVAERDPTGPRVLSLHDFGGLRAAAPWFCGVFGVVTFASIGLPGLAGFVGELLVLRGVFALAPAAAAFTLIGVVVTAVFLLTLIQRVWWGPPADRWRAMRDLSPGELVPAGLFVLLIVVVGVTPGWFVEQGNTAVSALAAVVAGGAR